ncbi:probable glycosyltransferase At5g03795 isoform X3 [Brachypodium distachyon]|uniref:probable glycosyltransferase At5g03795 isoform X3 n=1 Tax=Brachypodium distachyon TaxID=15368 RepID=UPI00071D31DE|nr:probable glycosyltransferase At5g03795 isoform X3 [Brachypodium distachyon]|eukprot:XP_014753917.1 probable glycosyltransferase At5g03795 isoform X3 [Brachypodium distachyon]
MPHHAPSSQHALPRKLLTRRRAVASCAAVAVLTAAVILLAAPTSEAPNSALLVGASLLSSLREETHEAPATAAAGSSSPPPLASLVETILSSRIAPATSMFPAPAPSPVENFDDTSNEEPEHPGVKPISSGPPTSSSNVSGDLDMSGHAAPPPKREQILLWSTAADEELLYAKKEIVNAPLVTDDPDLYAPLFLNVSIFKRSYELMERLLKVFIYHDGAKPIFHSPELKGIYASEGWFMKLIEGNQNFVVRDPNRAHLFYLPYSSRQLEHNLYVPGSNTLEPLSIFVKNYIDMISAKFPYWNRTKGADHFFVACHDWGPYTTKLHDELRRNTIKALCNADLSEGVFIRGRDVSLPETFVRSPRRPLRDIGGKPATERSILAFFAGQMHGRVRPILLQYWGGKDTDMRIYGRLPRRITRRMNYVQHMKSSKYCICPMGYEVNSPRIVEAIYYECIPVIIADNFVLPFDDALDWSTFSVVVPEKDVPRLKEILLRIPESRYITMQSNVKKVQKHFLWHAKPVKYDIFHMILHSVWFSRVNQAQIQ